MLRRRGRIGWSPIATDRRPNGRQNILRSGVLTISSIKLSPGRATRRRRGRPSGRDGSESKKHRQFVGRRGRNSAGKTLHPSFVHTSCSAHPGRRRTGTESYPLTSPRFGQRNKTCTRSTCSSWSPPRFPSLPPHTSLVPRGYLSRYDAIYDARSALVSQFEPDVITKIESRVTGRTGREGSRLEERPVKELLNPRGFVINLVGRASRNVEPTPTGFGKRWNRRKRRTRTI